MIFVGKTALGLASLGLLLALSAGGCSRDGGSTGAGPSNATSNTSQAPAKPTTGGGPAGDTKATAPPIAGDRLANLSPVVEGRTVPQDPSPFRFADITKEGGIDFVHVSGMNEKKHFPTANGSGVAMFDYDGDGKLDLYFATATFLPLGTSKNGPNKLYKNLGGGKFKDMTAESGLGYAGFCHGIIAGDLDNDGDVDVFLCNYGQNVLYQNNGNGTYTDITKKAGVDKPGWSSSGALLDYDNDGDLDIYVSNYGEWKLPDDDLFCGDLVKKVRLYCSPRSIRTTKHYFYRNNGDGTFTDVYSTVIFDPFSGKFRGRDDGHGFGVVAADFDGDGKVDLYVANDMNPNFLFRNRGDGTFEDITEASGAAFDEKGQAQSGMGVDCEDVNGDGLPELFVTNFSNEYNTLYQNLGKASFLDTTAFFGLAADTMPYVKWGTALADFDSDGWPDIFAADGHVDDNRKLIGQPVEYAEPPLLHRNIDGKRFKLSTRDVGPYFASRHVGRGAAFGDLDDDGDIDIVVNHKDDAPAVLRNDTPLNGNSWIRFHLIGTKSNRDAIGTLVKVEVGPRTLYRQRKGGCSMMSTNDGRVLVGLGKAEVVDRVTILWPSGTKQVLEGLKPNQTHKITEPAAAAKPSGK
jgi:hypothetical protein